MLQTIMISGIDGFTVETTNCLMISDRFTMMKFDVKTPKLRAQLSNDSLRDESAEINQLELDDQTEDEGLSMEALQKAREGAPDEIAIMKELLGINVFTYVLAGLIAFFLSMNIILGPGWLGQSMGLEGTGTFTQISDSLPATVDLSGTENLL